MRPFLSRLGSEVCRLWLLCGAYLFSSTRFSYAGLPIWNKEVEEFPSLLPMLASNRTETDDVEGKTKSRIIISSQTSGNVPSNMANLLRERTGRVKLHEQFDKPLALPPMGGVYDWSDHLELPGRGQGVVVFTADCSNDVHVAISPEPQSVNPMYEFVIGGWSNTTSVVRRKSQGPHLCTVPVGLNKPRLDAVNDLWISIDKTTQLLRVGRGREPSFESMFFMYKDPQFLLKARYVCFSTWNVPATYSGVLVLAME